MTNVKTEFVDTIRGALDKYAEGQPNMIRRYLEIRKDYLPPRHRYLLFVQLYLAFFNSQLTGLMAPISLL